ncbi:hypothetical protein PLICRDRAFT_51358 [Plicaturopsis crispa FD-325 SS-3]|nr:hypothetical protein PLICRDRAFT_51358 [Plicaturopsis crispa FD-325 SS-3]
MRIPQLSTVHRGVAFEQKCLQLLQQRMSMSLRRVGGKSDGGIDLQGWWWLPPLDRPSGEHGADTGRRRLRVLAQCKAEKKKMGPNYVREMEGVLYRHMSPAPSFVASPDVAPSSSTLQFTLERGEDAKGHGYPIVALLISESRFTKSTLLRAQSSPVPFFLLYVPPAHGPDGGQETEASIEEELGAAFWNPALGGKHGLLGGEMEARWERRAIAKSVDAGRVGLWWKGKRLDNWVPPDEE